MKTIKLSLAKRYQVGNKTYLAGETYTLTDDLANMLLSRVNERDMPYFVAVEGKKETKADVAKEPEKAPEKESKPEAPAKKTAAKKKAAVKKAAPKKAAKKKAAAKKSDGDEPSVSV